MDYRHMIQQSMTPIIRDEGLTHTVDSLGRIVLPKSLRTKYGVLPGNSIDFYSIEYLGDTYFAFKVGKNYGDKAKYVRTIETLKELGLEVPELLYDMAGMGSKL